MVKQLLLAVTLAASFAACGGDEPQPQQEVPQGREARLRLWNRGLVELDQHRFIDAKATFDILVRAFPNSADAWVNHGIASMNGVTPELFRLAEDSFGRALAKDKEHLPAHYCLGVLLKHLGRGDEAERHFRSVLGRDPHDPTANYYLATLLAGRGALDEAEPLLRKAISSEPHLSSAINRLFQVLLRGGKAADAEALKNTFLELERSSSGDKAGIIYTEMGRYGEGIRSFPGAPSAAASEAPSVTYRLTDRLGGTIAETRRPFDLPADGVSETLSQGLGPGVAIADVDLDGLLDIYVAGGNDAGNLYLNRGGRFSKDTVAKGVEIPGFRAVSGTFGDLDNDGRPELVIAGAGGVRIFKNGNAGFVALPESLTAAVAGFPAQVAIADLDADGDLDLFAGDVLGTPAGPTSRWPHGFLARKATLLNNNRDGTYLDIAERAGTANAGKTLAVIAADLDQDHDADLLVVTTEGLRVLRNDRIWRFADVSEPSGLRVGARPSGAIVADLDDDGHPEILVFHEDASPPALFRNRGRFVFEATTALAGLAPSGTATTGCVLDADNDGHQDVFLAGPVSATLLRGTGALHFVDTKLAIDFPKGAGVRTVLAADFTGDGILDLAASFAPGILLVFTGSVDRPTRWLEVVLKGVREEGKTRANTGGTGARISMTAGSRTSHRDVVSTGGVLGGLSPIAHFGLGTAASADYVRVSWPDDVLQSEPNLSSGQRKSITEVNRKGSSCPVLFVWNGERFEFVTDFLGVGGLGFFVEPGVYAPPDPTERVKIPTLVPRNGAYEIRIHEPMEEAVYLDLARLLVIDHPPGTEIWPDERLATGPPAQTGRLLVIETSARAFPRALSAGGKEADVNLVTTSDRCYQPGILPDPRFLGYAAPQEIILDFGDALRRFDRDRPLFLFLDGWVEYPYSYINFAAWQAGIRMRGLSIDVENARGSWTEALPEFGYPAGLPRMMTVDVSTLPRDGTGRIRLRTNLELGIDRVFLAVDRVTDGVRVHDVAAGTATLRASGYPREFSPDGREPLIYDYALMDPAIDFKTLTGDFTRFGDVAPLLGNSDDRYVIFGRAEEIVLRYAIPPAAPDTVRSFVLDADGYCKDMDLYTAFPETVEPLPFHAMSAYPYPPSECFPSDPAHAEFRARWNTRHLTGGR